MESQATVLGVQPGLAGSGRRRKKPGPKPGGPNPGAFRPGHDPRRHLDGPRSPTVKKDFQSQIREHTETAIQVLSDCMTDAKASWKERLAAAELALSHGHGSPVNRILHAQSSGGGQNPSDMDLDALLAEGQRLVQEARESGYIEGECVTECVIDDETASHA